VTVRMKAAMVSEALPVSIAATVWLQPGMPTPHVTRLRLAHMAGRGILTPPSSLLPIVRFAATASVTSMNGGQ
jgi:hypothetical protein